VLPPEWADERETSPDREKRGRQTRPKRGVSTRPLGWASREYRISRSAHARRASVCIFGAAAPRIACRSALRARPPTPMRVTSERETVPMSFSKGRLTPRLSSVGRPGWLPSRCSPLDVCLPIPYRAAFLVEVRHVVSELCQRRTAI